MEQLISIVGAVVAILGLLASAGLAAFNRRAEPVEVEALQTDDEGRLQVREANVESGGSLVIIHQPTSGQKTPLWVSLVPLGVALLGGTVAIVPQLLPDGPDCMAYIQQIIDLDRAIPDADEEGLAAEMDFEETQCIDPGVLLERITDTVDTERPGN